MSDVAAIVLAAGKSTRMKSDLPKVLHDVCGRPMLHFVLNACRLAGIDKLCVVVGHQCDMVRSAFSGDHDIVWVDQTEQLGTGHAVMCCRDALQRFAGTVLVIAGDMPLIRRETLGELIDARESRGDAATIATTVLDDPTGYGRIIRDGEGNLVGIVEHRDCDKEKRAINEVNPSYYCFDSRKLFSALDRVRVSEGKGEYYLTDVIQVQRKNGESVSAHVQVPSEDATGVNSRFDLAVVNRLMQDRIQRSLLDEGVTIVDPDTTWIEADAAIGADSIVFPFSFIGAGATIGSECRIGPHANIARDAVIQDQATVGADVASAEVVR
ncbi:MAG: NTP transferase domain-containing protein [Planctomycetes bacterium]|nr:NTP transferase domain-containing protein [Planctomycetota bacterium]MBI3833240.1 NTP transferase domain-containing protein [Planctomycetota bacterium]